ncbi:MAG: hypothetical protein ABI175_08935 [Polyangiales bacterium]
MRLAVLLVIGLSACGDNLSLIVDVTHRIPVAKTVISVYESASLDCSKIEFGDVDANALMAALVAEEIHDANGVTGSLDGISRTERKYVVARGYDADDTLLTAGCEVKDVVGGKDHLAVNADEALTVSAILDTSDPNLYTFVVIASAPDGSPPTVHRKVSWQVYGPDGTKPLRTDLADMVEPEPNQPQESDWTPKTAACTNDNGVTRIHPVPPHQIGGFATRIRASWAANALPLQSALSKVDPAEIITLHPAAGVTRPCAVKVSGGEHRLVCIDTAGPANVARELKVSASAGRSTATQTNITTLAGTPIAVVSVPSGNGRDVYLIEAGGNLVPLFASTTQTLVGCLTCTVSDAVYGPACTDDNEAKIYLQTGLTQVRSFTLGSGKRDVITGFLPTGASIAGTLDEISLEHAGCVTSVVPKVGIKQRQAVTFSTTSTFAGVPIVGSHGFYGCGPVACNKLDFPVGDAGTAFVQVDATDNRILGAAGDATGVVLSSWVVIPDPMGGAVHRLIERDRVPAASIPNRLVAGKLDDDGGYDIMWDFGKRGSILEIAYSRMAAGQRLEAVAGVQLIQMSDLQIDDISNDGAPDLIAIGATATGVPVIIVPTHVAPLPTTTIAEQCN